jgi:hypothetical protein
MKMKVNSFVESGERNEINEKKRTRTDSSGTTLRASSLPKYEGYGGYVKADSSTKKKNKRRRAGEKGNIQKMEGSSPIWRGEPALCAEESLLLGLYDANVSSHHLLVVLAKKTNLVRSRRPAAFKTPLLVL